MDNAIIGGVGIHPFGRFDNKPYTEIGRDAVIMALEDAGIEFKDIQAAFVSRMYLPATAGVKTLSTLGRTAIPIVDVEAACAGGGACLRLATTAINSGMYDVVLALGVEKMPRGFMDPRQLYDLWQCYGGLTQNPMYWAMNARRHMHVYGTTEEQIAKIAYKNHKNGVNNPYAMYRKKMTMEEIMNSALVCDPMRLFMICAPNEGAAAAILFSPKAARKYPSKPLTLAACSHRVSAVPFYNVAGYTNYETGNEPVTTTAAREAYEKAGIGPEDINCAEIQDTDSFCELEHYEQLLFCKEGEGGKLIQDGVTEMSGRLPVNMSGGLICKGEPVGASGLGMVFEICMQLRGEAGPRQVKGATVGLAQAYGSMGHVTVTIIKK